MFSDLHVSLRTLLRQRGFALMAVAILALGLGASISMFSLMNTLLLRPLPYPQPEQLVRIYRTAGQGRALPDAGPAFRDYQKQNTVFESMAAFFFSSASLAEDNELPAPVSALGVTPEFFSVFKVQPLLGRFLRPDEIRFDEQRVVVLSAEFWRQRFSGDPQIVGRRLRVDGMAVTVVGVMPPGFAHSTLWGPVDLWRPAGYFPDNDRHNFWLQIVARLKPGETLTRAQAEMSTIAARLDSTYQTRSGLRLLPLQESGTNQTGTRVASLTVALSLFLLLIACINLAGVQLARLSARGHEHAVRVALGAKRAHLIRQALAESLLLSTVGGGLGIVLAYWSTEYLASRIRTGDTWMPLEIPLDGRVVGFALALVLIIALAVGMVPAWLSTRGQIIDELRRGGRSIGNPSRSRLRQVLVITEMGLALLLLTAAGLFMRGLERFVDRDPGWQVDGVLTARITLPGARYARGAPPAVAAQRFKEFFDQLEPKLAGIQGVEHSALSWSLPLWNYRLGAFAVAGRPPPTPDAAPVAYLNAVTPDYFATLGIAVREGRPFQAVDGPNVEPGAIINETMARHFWPGQSAIGKRISDVANPSSPRDWQTIVGVVSDVRFAANLGEPASPFQIYAPFAQKSSVSALVALRGPAAPESLARELRKAVAEIDGELPVHQVKTAGQWIDGYLANFSMIALILSCFAVLGVILAALGVYGLFSSFVVQRTREIGIRVALGAQSGQVLWLVLGKGLRLAAIGAAVGVAAGAAVAPVLTSVAAELPAHDPTMVILLAGVLVAVALFACWLPARRATALNPMVSLRRD
jgi:putative ABC transport system permease protein